MAHIRGEQVLQKSPPPEVLDKATHNLLDAIRRVIHGLWNVCIQIPIVDEKAPIHALVEIQARLHRLERQNRILIMNQPLGTVKTRIRSGLGKLRQALAGTLKGL